MQIVGHFSQMVIFWSVIDFQKRFDSSILGFMYMDCVSWFKFMSQTCDFGCGFYAFGCFKQLFNLIFLFLFINLGIKVFQLGFRYKGLSKILSDFNGKPCDLRNNVPYLVEMAKKLKPKSKSSNLELNMRLENESENLSDEDLCNVDEVFDVMLLRKMVKREKQRADAAYTELDKERLASSTAADEAMAMIQRLQKEKSLIEMESNHHRRLAEEKQIHDQEVIQSLRWILMKHELERSYLEDHLRVYKRRFKILFKEENRDICEENDERMSFFDSGIAEGSHSDGLISSLDFDLLPP